MKCAFILFACTLAGPAAALENCDEWWFTRNLIFDRAGYCFASSLGQSIFDNTGCTPGDPGLDRDTLNIVAGIQALEQQWECKVDTAGNSLHVPDLPMRLQMVDIPVPDEYESGCMGWRGTPLTLRIARDDGAKITGVIEAGEDIYYGFVGVEGWSFVLSPGGDADMGWMRNAPFNGESCTNVAG